MNKAIMVILLHFVISSAFAGNYYVSPQGSDLNTGTTPDKPLKYLSSAVSRAVPGDTIWMRGGNYACSSTITLSKSGTEAQRYSVKAWPGEKPVLDFSGIASGKKGISLTGNYWVIKGLTIVKAGDNGLCISGGAYNLVENCVFAENKDTGLQLDNGARDNRIINCDSYFNADPPDYGDADGFAPKLTVGSNNYFYGCRAWQNCDDGWDGYMRVATTVPPPTTILENCRTWRNGYLKDGSDPGSQANGNGFKMGGSDDKNLQHHFILKNCLAFDNKSKGFDQNSNKGSMTIYNGTAFRNKGNDFSISVTLASGQSAIVKNSLTAQGNKINLGTFVIQEANSWNGGFTITAADFLSLDTTGITGPRNADGSLPDLRFLHLAPGSDLINAGVNVGLPFKGTKPDLGCFESEETLGIDLPVKLERDFFDLKIKAIGANLEISFDPGDEVDFSAGLTNINGTLVWSSGDFLSDAQRQKIIIPRNGIAPGIYLFHLSAVKKKTALKFRLP